MMAELHLSLIGFMGSGKTTVGQLMAQRLGRPFVDTDAMVEEKLGRPIAQIFSELGEEVFREAEQEALSDALRPDAPIVLSTGGGAPCAEGAMEWLRRRSLVVALQPPVEVLVARLSGQPQDRPLLQQKTGDALASHVQRLLLTRAACYAGAHVTWRQDLSSEEALDDALASIRWRLE